MEQMTTAHDRDYQRKLITEIKRLTYLLNQRHWTPQEVEEETLEGYEEPWHTAYDELVARKAAIKLSRATVMADWQIERLNTWNRAVVLGGEHYQQWRDAFITPIEEGRRNGRQNIPVRLARHRISRLIEYEKRARQDTLKWVAGLTPEKRVKFGFDDPTRYPASDTPACAQSPTSETAPRSR
jgi:hypothetical protein